MINKTPDLPITPLVWPKMRIVLMSLTLLGILGVLLKVVLFPDGEKKPSNFDYVFPETVPLSGWQLKETKKLGEVRRSGFEPGLDPGQSYKYVKDKETLQVETRYVKYQGNVNKFLIKYKQIPPATIKPKIKYIKETGHYGIFELKEQAFLSACVNPKGISTVTQQQFTKNRYLTGWGIQRTFFWIIGQQDLFDGRCLWTLMSVPINDYDPYKLMLEKDLQDEYQKLETAWVDWYRWWKTNLPPN